MKEERDAIIEVCISRRNKHAGGLRGFLSASFERWLEFNTRGVKGRDQTALTQACAVGDSVPLSFRTCCTRGCREMNASAMAATAATATCLHYSAFRDLSGATVTAASRCILAPSAAKFAFAFAFSFSRAVSQ